ncbi:MAG: DNA/RNA nuclease SfsA [Bacillota bacterium]|nr:DNA/RNA nuclease SfsA [Bacillota bacterium]
MKINEELIEYGYFHRRVNRFVAEVLVEDNLHQVHVPNSGRMKELLIEGNTIALIKKAGNHRKTKYQLSFVKAGDCWVSIDSMLPNRLMAAAVKNKSLEFFKDYFLGATEITIGKSRLDMLLYHEHTGKRLFVENKSVTLVEKGVAKFPDAPTERGTKHLKELTMLVKAGEEAAVIFLVQRNDAEFFTPNDDTDGVFGDALRKAAFSGVKVWAITCEVSPREVKIHKELLVKL